MCKVMELLKSKNDSVRTVKVQVGSSGGGKKMLRRSLNHLIPLEISGHPFEGCCNESLLPPETQVPAPLPT